MKEFFNKIKMFFMKKGKTSDDMNNDTSILSRCFDSFDKFFHKYLLIFVLIIMSIIAILIRHIMVPYLSGDMNSFLINWFNFFRSHGHLDGLRTLSKFADEIHNDYLYGYNTLLALFSYLKGDPIRIIKSISFIFDFALALGVAFIVYHYSKSKVMFTISYVIVLFAPTVYANSAIWGQADQIYVCIVIYFFLLLLKKHNFWASIVLGIAFAFKIQAIFIVPLLGFMFLNKKYPLYNLLFVLLGLLIAYLPSYLAGASFLDPFKVYGSQMGEYGNLNYGSGSIYAFIEMGLLRELFSKGTSILIAVAVVLFVMFIIYYKRIPCNDETMLYVATLYSLLTPFVLPHMHERYFFMSDIFILLYVLVNRKQYYLSALMFFSSINNYTEFLTGEYIFKFLGQDSVRLSAIINFIILWVLFTNMKKLFQPKNDKKELSSQII